MKQNVPAKGVLQGTLECYWVCQISGVLTLFSLVGEEEEEAEEEEEEEEELVTRL